MFAHKYAVHAMNCMNTTC